jgi:hypothetical protein
MALSNMAVFDKYVMPATIEMLAQKVAKFNAASNGAFSMTTEGFEGDFLQESFWSSIHSAQRRVDRYAAQGAAAATDLAQAQHNSVKVAGGFGPIRFEPSQMSWLQKPTDEGVRVISDNMSDAMLSDMLNTSIAALVGAIATNGLIADDAGAIDYDLINQAHALFGDHSMDIVANVMDGAQYHDLIGLNLANANNLFRAQGVMVVDILGKAIVVTDAPALRVANPGKTSVLGLASGAAVVHDAGDLITNIETSNGQTRIETTFQADYSFGLGLKGFAWDTANGGKSPDDTELGTGSNWDKVVTDDKHTAGVLAQVTTPA